MGKKPKQLKPKPEYIAVHSNIFEALAAAIDFCILHNLENYAAEGSIERLNDSEGRRGFALATGIEAACLITGSPLRESEIARGHGVASHDGHVYDLEFLDAAVQDARDADECAVT